MSDDKTQGMPVMADAGDMPTETLHTVDAQSTYDQSQRSGRATQDDKPRGIRSSARRSDLYRFGSRCE